MSYLALIALGALAGFAVSKCLAGWRQDLTANLMLGSGGAVVGGWLSDKLGVAAVAELTLNSLVVAMAGAACILAVYHVLRRA